MFPIARILNAVSVALPERVAISQGDRQRTFGELLTRSERLARTLLDLDVTCYQERDLLAPWESGQAHVGLFLENCLEYPEVMFGCFKARAVPFNVNYRYVHEELAYLFQDASARAIVYQRKYADEVARLSETLTPGCILIEVDDGGRPEVGGPLVTGALAYDALPENSKPLPEPSADDLYMLYTGGTTGMPKGVLWRQADIVLAVLGGVMEGSGEVLQSLDAFVARAESGQHTVLIAPPFMHAAGQWIGLNGLHCGTRIVLPKVVDRLDAAAIWRAAEREQVERVVIVGDAFAVPLLDELRSGSYELSSLKIIHSTGAALQPHFKEAFCELIPGAVVLDTVGSSEGGRQGQTVSAGKADRGAVRYKAGGNAAIVSEDQTRILTHDDQALGWWAAKEPIPLGYLGDQVKTEKTFITIDGARLSLPGDRARYLPGGEIEMHGRDSVTINSGGEKIFAEEVEAALREHAAVYDVVVVGRPSDRWGNEVVAVVQLREGQAATIENLREVAGRSLARYKLPKDCVFTDSVQRAPSGKPDYRWAKSMVVDS